MVGLFKIIMKLIYFIIQPSNSLKPNLNICRSYSLPPNHFYKKNAINNNYYKINAYFYLKTFIKNLYINEINIFIFFMFYYSTI